MLSAALHITFFSEIFSSSFSLTIFLLMIFKCPAVPIIDDNHECSARRYQMQIESHNGNAANERYQDGDFESILEEDDSGTIVGNPEGDDTSDAVQPTSSGNALARVIFNYFHSKLLSYYKTMEYESCLAHTGFLDRLRYMYLVPYCT